MQFCAVSEVEGVTRQKWRQQCKECWTVHKGGQEWPEEMPEGARRQVIPGDGKCLYWALSAVDRAGGRAAAEEVRKALREGEMARPPESGWAG